MVTTFVLLSVTSKKTGFEDFQF